VQAEHGVSQETPPSLNRSGPPRPSFDVPWEQAAGKATGDQKMADGALKSLDRYRQDFGAFIESATGGELSADTVAESLQMHVNALVDAIDLALTGNTDVFDAIYTAAHEHMPETATALAGGIAAQMPEQFPKS
jgi:hypothetical protein